MAWSFASLANGHPPLLDSIASASSAKISALGFNVGAGGAAAENAGDDAGLVLSAAALHATALDFNALAWSFAFLSRLAQARDVGVLAGLAAIGREVDRRVASALPEHRTKASGDAPALTG